MHEGFTLAPDANEVAEVFEVPLAFLLDPRNRERHSTEWEAPNANSTSFSMTVIYLGCDRCDPGEFRRKDPERMMRKLDPARVEWMREASTLRLMGVLAKDGGDARFVGGVVRNTLLGLAVKDIDIATPLPPDEVMRRLKRANIRAVPTGIDHGTITAIVDGRPFEVTTLRRDVSTDGRHATVTYTTDWREDAARRDFTINALYASADGEIFDYHGGFADLAQGRVRFIGDARARIREDYLRILRLFRFHAWYGKGDIDPDALNAVAHEKAGLAKLSGERIQQEFLRLLEAANPVAVLRIMAANGILAEILPGTLDIARLEHLRAIDAENFFIPDPMLRLAALLSGGETAVADRFKLLNKDRARLEEP